MSILATGVLHEMEHEAESTKRMLERLPDDKADWQPHKKSMTLKKLADHIVDLQTWFGNVLKEDTLDFMTIKREEAKTFQDLAAKLTKGIEENKAFVKTTDDDFWLKNFTVKAGDHIIMQGPRISILRGMLHNHLIHHRGQLSLYMRLLDIPVPGVYGPSADDREAAQGK